jgi:hypothetical protein
MKLKLSNIQFSKISIFHLKKNPLLAANRFYHKLEFHQYYTDLKNGFGGADSPASKRFIGGPSHYELSYSALP